MCAPTTVLFRVRDETIGVRVDRAELADVLRRIYPAYLDSADGAAAAGRTTLALTAEGSGFRLRSVGGDSVLCDSLDEATDRVEFALTELFLQTCANAVQLHASGAVVGGRAVLALGGSGAGKSSLAVRWCRRSIPVLGDDAVLIEADGCVHPFKRLFKAHAPLLTDLGFSVEDTPFWSPEEDEVWFDPQVMGGGWSAPAPVGVVAVCRLDPESPLSIEPLGSAALMNALMHSRLPTGLEAAASFDRLLPLSHEIRAIRLSSPSSAEAAAYLMRALQ